MKKYIAIEEEVLVRLVEGKCVEGSLRRDQWTGIITFNAYKRLSREPGYVRPKPVTLHETPNGRLNMTPKMYNIYVSAKRSLGRERCASELQMQARELTSYLRISKTIDDILDEI